MWLTLPHEGAGPAPTVPEEMRRMCSYCGCQSIDVIGRFMGEHEDIINAAGLLRRAVADGNLEAVPRLCAEVARLLNPHTDAEEVGLFSVMRDQGDFAEQIDGLCGEHSSLDDQLAAIAAGDLSVVDAFYQDLRDHIDKEDNGLFPAAAMTLDGPEWEQITDQTPVQVTE